MGVCFCWDELDVVMFICSLCMVEDVDVIEVVFICLGFFVVVVGGGYIGLEVVENFVVCGVFVMFV